MSKKVLKLISQGDFSVVLQIQKTRIQLLLICPRSDFHYMPSQQQGCSTVIENLKSFNDIGKLPPSLQARFERENYFHNLLQNTTKLSPL